MKKRLCIILLLVSLLTLCACGSKTAEPAAPAGSVDTAVGGLHHVELVVKDYGTITLEQIEIMRFPCGVSRRKAGILAEAAELPAERNMNVKAQRLHALQNIQIGFVRLKEIPIHRIGRVAAEIAIRRFEHPVSGRSLSAARICFPLHQSSTVTRSMTGC